MCPASKSLARRRLRLESGVRGPLLRGLFPGLLALLGAASPAASEDHCGGSVASRVVLGLPRASEARAAAAAAATDIDDIAVLEDRGDLVVRRNPFDLAGSAVRLEPRAGGAWTAAVAPVTIPAGTTAVAVSDLAPATLDLPFAFPFYGASWRQVFVHADGHLTFGAPDARAPGVPRLFDGPPRVAPLYADLDLGRGGSVTAQVDGSRAVVVWRDVPAAAQINRNTFAVVLHASGVVELAWDSVQVAEAWVGVTPGAAPLEGQSDLSAGRTAPSGPVLERFSDQDRIDLVAVTARFAATHDDVFDQVAVYTTRGLNPLGGTLAFEVTIRNATTGIGTAVFDDAASWGAGAALQSVLFMDTVRPYRDVDGFEVLGHEVGHRWLASLRFAPAGFGTGTELMTGDGVHWSFFFDSDASVLGGNDLVPVGDGRFESVDVARRFGPIDQYAMGLRDLSEVPPLVVYDVPDEFRPPRAYKSSSSPEVGVSFSAFPRTIAPAQVPAAMGPRTGPPSEVPRLWRLAFVLVADAVAPATAEHLAPLGRIRRNFEEWFRGATDGRGQVTTTLR
jgi:hypothetical protein